MQKVKVSFDTWIQLLGMVGVLGGLVFVGLEMQQTQRIALAGQVQARDQRGIDRIIAGLEGNLTALKLFYENDWSYEELTSEEKKTGFGDSFETSFRIFGCYSKKIHFKNCFKERGPLKVKFDSIFLPGGSLTSSHYQKLFGQGTTVRTHVKALFVISLRTN